MYELLTEIGPDGHRVPLDGVHTLDRRAVEAEMSRRLDHVEELRAHGQEDTRLYAALLERCGALDRRLGDIEAMQPTDRARLAELAFGPAARTERGAFGARPARRGDDIVQPPPGRVAAVEEDARALVVRSGESLAQWGLRTGRAPEFGEERGLHFGKIVRGLARGDWSDAVAEERAMAESPVTAGGHLVPVPLAANLIDRARAVAQVTQMGATVAPMTSSTLKIPRLVTGLTPDWRVEAGPVNDKAVVLDAVTLQAQSLACMVRVSWELIDDAPNVDDVIRTEFASAFATEFDRVALRGSGAPPEPRGVRNTSGVTITALGGNGVALSSWDWLIDSMTTIRTAGWEPTGALMHPRTAGSLAKLRESGTTGPYLQMPAAVATFPQAVTTEIPANLTQGTSNLATEVYVANWATVLLGVRIPLRIRILEERYADVGQVAFLADLRGDVGVAQPTAVNILTGVL